MDSKVEFLFLNEEDMIRRAYWMQTEPWTP